MVKQQIKGIKTINKFAKFLCIPKGHKNIYKITEESNGDKKITKCTDENGFEVEFLVDEKDKIKLIISLECFEALMSNTRDILKENSALKLEKSIMKHMPINFEDVWTVAIGDIIDKDPLDVNYDEVIKNIKIKHPNLFLDLSNFINSGEKID